MAEKKQSKQPQVETELSLEDLAAIIAAGPGGGAVQTRSALGVPDEYVATRPAGVPYAPGRTVDVAPRYFDGDELIPAAWSSDRVASFQRALDRAGLYQKGDKYRLGVWDPNVDAVAYGRLLQFANASGLDEQEALSRWGEAGAIDETEVREPLTVRLTNPDDLREIFDTAVKTKLGRKVPDGWLDGMIAAYQAQEANAQQLAYNDAATVVDPPSPAAFAMAEAERRDPTGVDANDWLGRANEFFDLLSGPVSNG